MSEQIGAEACGSAHHWARKLQSSGHTVRLMAPQFVKPYVKEQMMQPTPRLIREVEPEVIEHKF
jgi:transposase